MKMIKPLAALILGVAGYATGVHAADAVQNQTQIQSQQRIQETMGPAVPKTTQAIQNQNRHEYTYEKRYQIKENADANGRSAMQNNRTEQGAMHSQGFGSMGGGNKGGGNKGGGKR
ncbi:hypothetical protein QCB44_04215 [Thiomicrorhabdus sp. zzn3]|uniref:hypothetical protein n=1 Tax=Thiomicrorhabdus sp. zzn3 TaxID=3039775 RepID=UPI0024366CB7|nr:hypothetical protein [Thiomicrorhabdus sp. zzn3]MDG6777907.1 hypothetical protein [Thiomicrorhabdus sp. zzn3]